MLVRLSARSRELVIRSAIGASRWDLVRALLAESLLLSLGGAALGVVRRVAGRGGASVRRPGGRAACRGHRRRSARARRDRRRGDRERPAVQRRACPPVLACAGRRGRDATDAREHGEPDSAVAERRARHRRSRTRRRPARRVGIVPGELCARDRREPRARSAQCPDGARPAARRAARDRHQYGGGAAAASRPPSEHSRARARDTRASRSRRFVGGGVPLRGDLRTIDFGIPGRALPRAKISTSTRSHRTTFGR